ncbi:ArsR family transcriptional regulator [Chloroflexi bacterium TSY]|nr:ArsR family transcriptional regulator [Chloroflexi bacterium TSY]
MLKRLTRLTKLCQTTTLQLLRRCDMSAGELADHFDSTKPTLSRHYSVLRDADLIQGSRSGTTITYRLNVNALEEVMLEMMEMFKIDVGGTNHEK